VTRPTAFVLAIALIGGSAPTFAQETAEERINRVTVYGSDPCPRGTDEIVVCARRPESERYRIPANLRDEEAGPEGDSWAARASAIEYVGRSGVESCSTTGPGGSTGCLMEIIRASREDRRKVSEDVPGR